MAATSATVSHSHAQALSSLDKACEQDWSKCADNRHLTEHYSRWDAAISACKESADEFISSLGTPNKSIPRGSAGGFIAFELGSNYPRTGVAVLFALNFEYRNDSGARHFVKLECTYDLRSEHVIAMKFY